MSVPVLRRALYASHLAWSGDRVGPVELLMLHPMLLEHARVEAPAAPPIETLLTGRLAARTLADECDESARPALARAFCHAVVCAWWEGLAAREESPFDLREPLAPLERFVLTNPMTALAERMGSAAAQLEAERAAYAVGLTYTAMLPVEYRSTHGVYYTPPVLGTRLIDQATNAGTDWTTARVLDPACGGGAFLAPVARRIVEALHGCEPRILVHNVANRLRGYEIDPFAAWLSQVTLDAVLLPLTRDSGRPLPQLVTVCDTLRSETPRELFDLVIGNPPYKRVRLEPAQRAKFSRTLYGHANLYGLFTDIALQHTKIGGVIAYVTPTSFLAGEYYKNLRAVIGREAPPATIDFVAARKGVFDDVLQETLLATYRRGDAAGPVAIHQITPLDGETLLVETAAHATLPSDRSGSWLMPRNRDQVELCGVLTEMPHRLSDWGYSVSTGPLVWNRYKDQLVERAGKACFPLVWAEAVAPDGRFSWRAEKRNHARYFEARISDDWMITRTPCVLVQRTTAKEQHRRLIAAALPPPFLSRHGAVVIENHLNMVRPIVTRPPVSAVVLTAFLNSAAADRAFRCVSGSVAVSAYELEALPLPSPSQLEELARLLRAGAGRRRLDEACERLYAGHI